MKFKESELFKSNLITVSNAKAIWSLPSAPVVGNIPVLLQILDRIVEDWKTEVSFYKKNLNKKATDEMVAFVSAMVDLKPRFIQCLFSYIMFFFSLENGYNLVYSQLNSLNRELNLKIGHGKPPKRTSLINKMWLIRNYSVAHWAGTEKKENLDSIAGRYLESYCEKNDSGYDLENLQFGAISLTNYNDMTGEVTESTNRQVPPIPMLHKQCSSYLIEFDHICAGYLIDIKNQLPIVRGDVKYQ